MVIVCPEDQSKLKYIFELYIDRVIRGVHQFIDQNVTGLCLESES